MKKHLIIVLLGLGALSMAGCTKKIHPAKESIAKDSVNVQRIIIERDTLINTPSSEVIISIPLEELLKSELVPVLKSHKNATAEIKKVNGNLEFNCFCDTLSITARIKDIYEKEFRCKYNSEKETVIIKERYVPKMIKWLAIAGAIASMLIVVYIIKIFIK
ncbi:MAG: hypothetical protein H0X62_05930 [Bacteroidetes bacterium]|nr:hypothetical protein [Bacteroidota bacterium]